ncbi:Protein FAR1-RELATED SEQUENCE 5 [Dendrobium catenatum]|uniref:Protein FAR1-RELATED SEQUENCE 5 n=1 Tax=Dendrobium catenatum TaxID=906689 RepID=A0A2I0V9J6_9ASPA|nr:Protein FAR1-RELATED SEQUENCE 5 [Dendrobium catenatum]
MTDAGIRTIDAFSFLADEVGGVENIGFTRRDAYNFIQKIKRAKIELGDTNTLIELFKEHQLNDNMFSWDVQKDEFDRLLNFFWVDGIGKIDYDCFGDVVIFYTSYMLNKYNLVCAPFIGDLYRIRNKWSTAFNKDYFSMDILSTQRSESTNNVCHDIFKPTSSITEFETMGLLCSHCIIVLRQMAIGKIPEKYLLLRWSARARQDIYYGLNLKENSQNSFEASRGFIFRNYISRFAYEMSTRAQLNEEGEEFLLASMRDTSKKLDLIVYGKRKTYKST